MHASTIAQPRHLCPNPIKATQLRPPGEQEQGGTSSLRLPAMGIWFPEPAAERLELPVGVSSVSAGFPSPAEDFADRRLDINQFLVSRPSSTFYFLVKGDSMVDYGIVDGDYLVCDRSVNAKHEDLVVAFVGGERLVKQLYQKRGKVRLVAGNAAYPAIDVSEGMELEIWGVVVGRFGRVDALKRKR